jgi:branched-chain amino acid transport system permease protein
MTRATVLSPLVTKAGLTRGAVLVAALAAAPLLLSAHWLVNLLFFTALYAGMSVAWNLVGGFAGYPSLGHAAFFGVGAYATARMFPNSHNLTNSVTPFFAMTLVGLIAAAIAIPIGLIAMRTRRDVFAIVTITLLFVAQTLAFNLKGTTGGAQGAGVAVPNFAVATFERPFYYAAAMLLVSAMLIAYAITRSKSGLALTAIRADEDKARGIGVHTTGLKVTVFAVSAGLVAIAGGMWAYYIGFIYPQFAIDPLVTITIVLMAFLGGRGTVWGPVIGAFILMPAQQLLAYYVGGSRLYLIGYASIFLLTMLLLPRGIVPTLQHRRRIAKLAALRDGLDQTTPEPQARTAESTAPLAGAAPGAKS